MALFKVLRGQQSTLNDVAKVDGHAYFCWDDGTFWIDYKESDSATEVKRKQINKENWTEDIAAAITALKTELEGLITGAVNYLGVVSSFNDLANFSTAAAGDFCRVGTEFTFGVETAHVGDMLIALQSAPTNNVLHWDLIHNEYDWAHTHTVTVGGTVSKPSFTGAETTISMEYTPGGSVSKPTFTGVAGTATATYTPSGTISKPDIVTDKSYESAFSITDVGTLPSASFNKGTLPSSIFATGTLPTISTTYTTSNKTVKISFSAGTLPSLSFSAGTLPSLTFNAGTLPKRSAFSFIDAFTAELTEAPVFTGTEATISLNYTPAGSISQPTFSGTKATISADYTPTGSVSQPTFTGTTVTTSEPTA